MALLHGLVRSMIEHDAIVTTATRAKETRPIVEKLVTTAKADDLHARRQTRRILNDEDLVRRLFADIMPRFKDRPGGYTRMTRIGWRRGDAAPLVKLEFVED